MVILKTNISLSSFKCNFCEESILHCDCQGKYLQDQHYHKPQYSLLHEPWGNHNLDTQYTATQCLLNIQCISFLLYILPID